MKRARKRLGLFEGQLIATPNVLRRFSWEQVLGALDTAKCRVAQGSTSRVQEMKLDDMDLWVVSDTDKGIVTVLLPDED